VDLVTGRRATTDCDRAPDLVKARLFEVLRALVEAPRDVEKVAGAGLGAVLEALGATVGAVYVRDEPGDEKLRRAASVALADDAPLAVSPGEGDVGAVAVSGKARLLRLPETDSFVTRTFLGDIAPRTLVACPLKRQSELVGVIAVASPTDLDDRALESLELVAPHFASALAEARGVRERERASSYFERILSDLDAAVVVTDRAGRVTIWNPAATRLWGLEADQALGRPVPELNLARDLGPLRDAMTAALEARRSTTLEGVGVERDGARRLVRVRTSPLTDGDGWLAGSILIGVDITEERRRIEELGSQKLAVESLNAALRRQAEALAEQKRELELKNAEVAAANRAKSDFIGSMSHELRTPLNSIRGFCRLLLDEKRKIAPDEAREFLEIIDRNGRELLTLIDDILDVVRADSGRRDKVQLTPVPLHDVVREIALELRPLAEEKGIGLEIEVREPLVLLTDDARVRRILRNFVANGVKFTDQGRVVVRLLERDGGGARIEVEDTGPGITPEDGGKIWEPFERGSNGRFARPASGTGLGLSIARQLAGTLNGEVGFRSDAGKGSVFWLELPRTPRAAEDATPATPIEVPVVAPIAPAGHSEKTERIRRPEAAPLAGRRVLLVEDNEDSALLAKLILESRGAEVVHAPDAGAALAEIRRAAPDAVVMDLMLPGLDGYEASRAIRTMPERSHVPIVAATAAVLPGERTRALEAGCDDVVAKPFDAEALVGRVAAAIARRRAAGAPA
jgi:PAS domain S-box-containing protein